MTEVILGAGIIGLYTAYLLCEKGHKNITVFAKHLPGDLSSEYTSPIAGAHFSCAVSGYSDQAIRLNRISYPMLAELFRKFDADKSDAGIDQLLQVELFDEAPAPHVLKDMGDYVENFEVIEDKKWLEQKGAKFGIRYKTFNFFPPKLLVFLKEYLETQGVKFIRKNIGHITDVRELVDHFDVVFNCTGVLATQMGGIKDNESTYPIRGQVVSVKAPWIHYNISLSVANQPPTYIIPRVHSHGRVILGGYYEKHNWLEGTLGDQTKSILERTTKLMPELLKNGPLEILEERAAFRPGRDSGARIEREVINGIPVIHNYGAAGTGYQSGLAMSLDAVNLYIK